MKNIARNVAGLACALSMLAFQAPAGAAEDSRVTHYKNEVHLTAEQVRNRSKDLIAWQRNNWVAPRVCNGSAISWASAPAGKPTALYDCAPFQCASEGVCMQACSADANCAPGAKCVDTDASGKNGVCSAPDR